MRTAEGGREEEGRKENYQVIIQISNRKQTANALSHEPVCVDIVVLEAMSLVKIVLHIFSLVYCWYRLEQI